jgi:hypothetical protein
MTQQNQSLRNCLGVPTTGLILDRTMMHDDNNYVCPFEMMGEGACCGRLKVISQKDLYENSEGIIVKSKKKKKKNTECNTACCSYHIFQLLVITSQGHPDVW